MMKKIFCNPSVFIQLFIAIIDSLKKAKKNQLWFLKHMNEIVNKFLLAGDKSWLKCIEDSLDLHTVFKDHLLEAKKK